MDREPAVPPHAGARGIAGAATAGRRRRLVAGVAAVALAALVGAGIVLLGAGRAQSAGPRGPVGWSATAASTGSQTAPAASGWRGRRLGAAGTVTAITDSSITVRRFNGRSTTVGLTSSTTYYRDVAKATRADVKVGDRVVIRLADPRAAKPTASVVRVVLPGVAGTVSDVTAGSFTVTDRAGFRREVVTTSSTTYTRDGKPASRSVVAKGTLVRAVGTVDSSGTKLTATRVNIVTGTGTGRAGGLCPGGPGRRGNRAGFGGFGGPGPAPRAPRPPTQSSPSALA